MRDDRVFDALDLMLIILFFISWIHSLMVLLFYLSLLLLLRKRTAGCMKGLILLTTRGLMNPAAAASAGRFELLKWALIFLFSLYILTFGESEGEDRRKLIRILGSLLAFSISAAFFSFLVSSYPVTAAFKTAAFSISMAAVFFGTAADKSRDYWIEYFTGLYGILFLISIFLIPFQRFRTVNADFQGIFNHVNVFGAIAALYISAVLRSRYFITHVKLRNSLIILMIFMTYLSRSRTGMFAIAAVLELKYLFSPRSALQKICISLGGMGVLLLLISLMPGDIKAGVSDLAIDFIYKGDTSSVWAHRLGQMEAARMKFMAHMLTGSGFMVPYDPSVRDYRFTFGLVAEPGNLVWAVLGDTGLLGSLLFLILLYCIGTAGKKKDLYLPAGALAVNMGEMVFFSTNNYSILIYLLLAAYAFGRKEEGAES